MSRRSVERLVATALLPWFFACSQTVEERIAELDERASVSCGSLVECESHAEVSALLRHRIGHQAVQTDDTQAQRQHGENQNQLHGKCASCDRLAVQIIE